MRVLKFDLLYPTDYLLQKQKAHAAEIEGMSLEAYVDWIHSLQIGYGEVISKELKNLGWEVHDFYNQDPIFLQKLRGAYNINPGFKDLLNKERKDYLTYSVDTLNQSRKNAGIKERVFNEILIKRFIEQYNPDIIFLREPCQVNNDLIRAIKDRYLIVTLIGCNVSHPLNWRPHTSDIIFTIIPEYKSFFDINGIESYLFDYGTTHLNGIANQKTKKHDVTFVGLLGTVEQHRKTVLMESIAIKFDFKWWGPKGAQIDSYPNLLRTWQGTTAGADMFKIYAESKIVVNDYVDTAKGQAVNMRIKEVFSSGSFLLTRYAMNLQPLIEKNALKVFEADDDCLRQVGNYLRHEEERELIAQTGFTTGIELFDSQKKVMDMKEIMERKYQQKFKRKVAEVV